MKKLTSLVFSFMILSTSVIVQPAKAGITSMFNSMALMQEDPAVGLMASALSVGLVLGGVQMVNYNIPGGKLLGIALIVLDADAQLNPSVLEEHFAKTFPFIDNAESLSALTALVHTKVQSEQLLVESKTITVSEYEIRNALKDSDLNEVELNFVCDVLR
jgi:hypothetical protein